MAQRNVTQDATPSPRGHVESKLALWLVLFAGPVFWTAHLLIEYFVIAAHDISGFDWWRIAYIIVIVATAVPIALAALLSYELWRETGATEESDIDPVQLGRSRFMAFAGIWLNLLFLLLTLWESVAPFFLNPRAQP